MPENKINILLIEDNDGDAVLINEMLYEIRLKKFELNRSHNLKEGITFLENNKIDIVLLDLSLPDSSGLNTFLKLHEKFPDIPAILLTGLNDEELAVNSVQAGAQDYLVKGAIDSTLLLRAILYGIERSRLLKIVNDELNYKKTIEDALTKSNRALKVLSECNQIVVRAVNRDELLNNICRVLIEIGGFCFVWIAIFDDQNGANSNKLYKHSDCRGPEIYNADISLKLDEWIRTREKHQDALTLIYDDYNWTLEENNILFNDTSGLICKSSASFPLIPDGNLIGFFNIYSHDQNIFGKDEIKLLSELTDDISLGLRTIKIRKEQEKTLKSLKESDERFMFIVEATNSVIYRLDYSTMKYHYINPAIKKLTGYEIEELNRIGFRNLIEKVKNPRFAGLPIEIEELKETIEKKVIGEWQADYQIKTKNGEYRWLTDSSYPWYDESGKFLGSIGILRDITERMQAEEEIILAKEQAEEMNRLKTNFLSNMSHELRTPMVGILGYSEIMKNESTDTSIKRMSNLIYFSGTRLMETLNIILDLSRLEAGNMELTHNKVELIGLIKTVISNYQEQLTEKNLYMKIDSALSSLYFYTDERMLRNSINNLVNNAVKFTLTGGVKISVELMTKPEKKIIIKVIDTGIGISKDDQKIMWEEFRQVSEGFNRSYEGTGLGLTISKKFIQKLGGTIEVESELNKGTIFIISFPAEDVKAVYTENVESISGLAIKLVEEEQIKPKVLVVDDDETSRNVMLRFLKEKCIVECAVDGNDAIIKAGSNNYDAILMDINLGKGMNGLDATKIIRKKDGYDKIPIVAVTAYAMKGDKEEFLQAGCTAYISKPFSKLQFIPFIEDILKINI